ncbi:MAG: hypothetical protein KF902_14575 [Phycisphaeraceae bacterium]|nr:hypothetical protein [Phycisphaeraceae bacterium]
MASHGRHSEPIGPHPRGDGPAPPRGPGDRSTWNGREGGQPAERPGERLIGEIDLIQARLGELARESGAGGEDGGGGAVVPRLERLAMLGEISGFVAHEFNNILTPLLAHAQVALRQPRDAERMALALERVVASVKRASGIAGSIMELAKQDGSVGGGAGLVSGERGGVSRETGPGLRVPVADIARCARRAAEDAFGCEGGGGGAGWEGRVRLEIEPGLTGEMDESELLQVLLNLLLNARRANAAAGCGSISTGHDRIVVRGAARRVPTGVTQDSDIERSMPELLRWQGVTGRPGGSGGGEGGGGGKEESDNIWCVIEVVDCGGGVEEGVLGGLRRRGYRVVGSGVGGSAGSEVAGGVGGAGLGLEVSRRLVERAGGWLEIESRAGVGTAVRVWVRVGE